MIENDIVLVRQFAASGSEEAFAELVSRHLNLVFSVSLRQVRDPHLAEEVTQAVFLLLARKARSLGDGTVLASWLCRTARNVACNAQTIERRRQEREQHAYMESQLNETEFNAWTHIEPWLEPALSELGEKDHSAVVLRFLEGRSFKEVSTALGTTEAGAKMRVNRALEKLRKFFSKRGCALSAAAIAGAIAANSVQAAPLGLAQTVTAAAVQGTGVAMSTTTLIKTTLKTMTYAKLKTAAVGAGLVACLAGASDLTVQLVRAGEDSKAESSAAPLELAGFATPETAYKSFVYFENSGDVEKTLSACTAEEADRIKQKVASMPKDEVRRALLEEAKYRANYKVMERQVVSDTEINLLLEVQPSAKHPKVGHDLQVMQKVGGEWKYAGKFGVDVKQQ